MESTHDADLEHPGAVERAYKALFEGPHAVFVLDVTRDGRFKVNAFNAVEERLVGISSADASGQFVDDLLPEPVARELVGNYRRCVENARPISYDEEIDVPAGRRHCATTLVPVEDDEGRVHRIIGVARDTGAQQAATVALAESEERFRQLAENIREVFWMTDVAKSEVLYVSPGYETIWGKTCASLRAAPASWLDSIHPADRPRVEADLAAQRERPWETRYRVLRPDGSERWIRDRSFPVRDASGVVGRIVGLAEDITQLVHTEEQLRQSQKLEAIGLLAGGLAHDFNNLLSVIISYAYVLHEEMPPGDPRRADVGEVLRAGERAAELTRQLLAFSRKQALEPRVLDLRETVRGMERMLRRLLPGSVELVVLQESALGAVRADPGQIEQVILNLVVNASDAMPDGGALTIRTSNVVLAEPEAADVGAPPGAYVMLAVSDDGVGMDAETRARVFEPFFTTKGIGKGTGLGLSTVLGIVRQTGGAIRLESAPGRGTSFEVYLPRTSGAAATMTAPGLVTTSLRGTETVLVVEDEENVRALVRTILRRAGYHVLEAQSAGDALLISEQHAGPIDLLLTDVLMPRLGGGQLARRILPLRPEMKVLYMSGGPDASTVNDGTAEEEIALLQKPITPDALCRKVRAVLGGAREGEAGE